MRRYDAGYDYGRDYRSRPRGGRQPYPYGPLASWYPGVLMAEAPMYGWGWWGGALGWPPYGLDHRPGGYRPPRPEPPSDSATYGRRGDRFARRWAERHGYDVGLSIPPRRRGSPRHGRRGNRS